ncbi:MAG: N-6 DNA methylase [Burkholderiaceae bacterium]|nr:N-6 DNA methylase [Burkholderiaceae bacterium]
MDKADRLGEFIKWTAQHITGDEKGQAQIFLDRLFQAFGWPGVMEAGAICEKRVKNDNGGVSFADLVWKPVVLIEMKRRGTDLKKHYSQAFAYWTRLVPNRPRYVILCNFDELWVYDFETQLDTPVDTVNLRELSSKYGPLNFLFPGDIPPLFGNHQEALSRAVADKLAMCFKSMLKRGVDRTLAQRFVLQMLVALFAEDIKLLDRYFVTQLLHDCRSPRDTYDLLGGLFETMNTPGGAKGGRFKGVSYFNGGLFARPARVELEHHETALLQEVAASDWSTVRPEIFGTIFEHSLEKEDRHAFGAHYTNPVDIMKIVGPTIVEPWAQAIDNAKTLSRLKELLVRLESFTVLDPACGSGNFLYTAYRELKKLEARVYERMAAFTSINPNQRPFGFLSTRNFFGIDVNAFAVDIAKVTMMLAHKLSIDELHINEQALPLDNLDANFRVGDALIGADGTKAQWFKADAIIGNPPFLGAKLIKPELGRAYSSKLRGAYPEVPGMADLCVYWLRKAHDELRDCTASDPFVGRAGFVGTQNIRSNKSRMGGLDYVVETGTVVEAVESQPWSGEANVNVAIVNWVKTLDPTLLPKKRRLWFKVAPPPTARRRPRGSGQAHKHYELDMREVPFINSALSHEIDISGAAVLVCNTKPKVVFQGITPGHKGFLLLPPEHAALIAKDAHSASVIYPYVGGDHILAGAAKPKRFVIDFEKRTVVEAANFKEAFARVQATVLSDRVKAAEAGKQEDGVGRPHHEKFLSTWWQLSWGRSDLVSAIAAKSRYLACSRVTKRPLFVFVASSVRPGDSLQVFALDDDYSFGILQGIPHQAWFVARSSKLTERLRYTPESVFDTFPWPQAPSAQRIVEVAKAGAALRQLRTHALAGSKGGLRALYRTLDLPGQNPLKAAHAKLDDAVLKAYGFTAQKALLSQLLDLNQDVAAKQASGVPVTGPGIPPHFPDPHALLSTDCIGP